MFSSTTRREIVVLLCLKGVALFFIYQVFFAPLERPEPNGRAVAAHLLAPGD